MKTLNKLFATLAFAVCTTSSISFAQSPIVPGNFVSVDVEIVSIATRPAFNYTGVNGAHALHVIVNVPINLNCMSSPNSGSARWPVIFSDRSDFKLVKETLQMAYALKKPVKIHAAQCANFSATAEQNGQYPVIYGVDTL